MLSGSVNAEQETKPVTKVTGFLLGETCGCGQRHFTSCLGHAARTFPCTNRDGRFYQRIIFSMPEKHEMEYVPVEMETTNERSGGLRLFLERLLVRLLRHSCICPSCQRSLVDEAKETVIEF